jgi:large subunit ribosomal protein L25
MSTQQHIQLAKLLPPRLLRFFEKFPPPSFLQSTSTSVSEPSIPTPASTDANAAPIEPSEPPILSSAYPRNLPAAAAAHAVTLPYHNPFLPRKSHTTGRWHSPLYGLRKQADLVKLATSHGVVDLLPWTSKKPGEKEARRIESGLRVKGTGEGQKVKGKLWERTLKGRMEMRRKAMLEMPQLVQEWKQVCLRIRLILWYASANAWCRKVMVGDGKNGRVERRKNRFGYGSVAYCKEVVELLSCSLLGLGRCIYSTSLAWVGKHTLGVTLTSKICFVPYRKRIFDKIGFNLHVVIYVQAVGARGPHL